MLHQFIVSLGFVLFGAALCLGGEDSQASAPPRVTETAPADGARAVDPYTRFIRVEFDQDMAEGNHSWVGGGERYPTVRGAPYWEGPRVAVLPVALRPKHEYWLSINSHTFFGFQNKAGVGAEPYEVSFETGPAHGPPTTQAVARAENAAAVPILRRQIDRHYSYRDLREVDWAGLFERWSPRLERAESPAKFAQAAGELLAQAKDIHIWLEFEGQQFATHRRRVPPNCDIRALRKRLDTWEKRSRNVASARLEGNIGYLVIASWGSKYAQDMEAALEALRELNDTSGLVIDVRMNAGGDEGLAQRVAGCFVSEPVVYAQHVWRWADSPDGTGFTEPQDRVLQPTADGPHYDRPVVVLMGRHVMSSCEAFLLMMKQVPQCKLFGERSYGASGNPRPHGLPNGVVVYLPAWKSLTPTGESFEGRGLEPDVIVVSKPGDFAEGDPVLSRAVDWLKPLEQTELATKR